jgi:hypothetical protein
MKRISKELAQKETTNQPKQEFRVNITIKTECAEMLVKSELLAWINEFFNGSQDVGTVEVTNIEEHLNRTLDVNKFTDEEIKTAFRVYGKRLGSNPSYVEMQIEKALTDKDGVTIYWNSDAEKVFAYYR